MLSGQNNGLFIADFSVWDKQYSELNYEGKFTHFDLSSGNASEQEIRTRLRLKGSGEIDRKKVSTYQIQEILESDLIERIEFIGSDSQGIWEWSEDSSSFLSLPLPIRQGQQWETALGLGKTELRKCVDLNEAVWTPAGVFTCIHIVWEIDQGDEIRKGTDLKEYSWNKQIQIHDFFASGIGRVKRTTFQFLIEKKSGNKVLLSQSELILKSLQ